MDDEQSFSRRVSISINNRIRRIYRPKKKHNYDFLPGRRSYRASIYCTYLLSFYIGLHTLLNVSFFENFLYLFEPDLQLSKMALFLIHVSFSFGQCMGAPFYGIIAINFPHNVVIKTSLAVMIITTLIFSMPFILRENYRVYALIMTRLISGYASGFLVLLRLYIATEPCNTKMRNMHEGIVSSLYYIGMGSPFMIINSFLKYNDDDKKTSLEFITHRFTLPVCIIAAIGIFLYIFIFRYFIDDASLQKQKDQFELSSRFSPFSMISESLPSNENVVGGLQFLSMASKVKHRRTNRYIGIVITFILFTLFYIVHPISMYTTYSQLEYGYDFRTSIDCATGFQWTNFVTVAIGCVIGMVCFYTNKAPIFIVIGFCMYTVGCLVNIPMFGDALPEPAKGLHGISEYLIKSSYKWRQYQCNIPHAQLYIADVIKGLSTGMLIFLLSSQNSNLVEKDYNISRLCVYKTVLTFCGSFGRCFQPIFYYQFLAIGGPLLQQTIYTTVVFVCFTMALGYSYYDNYANRGSSSHFHNRRINPE